MKKLTLYHYSNVNFDGNISPLYFGDNSYSANSARLCGVKRAYFYLKAGERERYLESARFLYTAEVESARLYNLVEDKKAYAGKLNGKHIYQVLKSKGYAGAIGNNGFDRAVLFDAVKIKSKIAL